MIEAPSLANHAMTGPAGSALQADLEQTQQWMNILEGDQPRIEPRTSGLGHIGVDGAGLLVFEDHGRQVLARQAVLTVGADGRIIDDRGAVLLGYPEPPSGEPRPLVVPFGRNGLSDIEVDDNGQIKVVRPAPQSRALRDHAPLIVGHIAIALPPYPQADLDQVPRMTQQSLGVRPRFYTAGDVHVGRIRHNPPVIDPAAMRAKIRALWDASGRGEIAVALAASADALERTALNLVR